MLYIEIIVLTKEKNSANFLKRIEKKSISSNITG